MTVSPTPFPGDSSTQARREALAGVVEAIQRLATGELDCAERLLSPYPGAPLLPRYLALRVTAPRVPGAALVFAVSLVRQAVSTLSLPASVPPEVAARLAPLQSTLRGLGVGAVFGSNLQPEPYPGGGQPVFLLVVTEPAGPPGETAESPDADPADGAERAVSHATLLDADAVAQAVAAWRAAALATTPPEPRDAASLAPLRALATARRALLAATDPTHIDACLADGEWAEAWRRCDVSRDISADLTVEGGAALAPGEAARLLADLAALHPLVLALNFPRDDRGKMALAQTVLLNQYASDLAPTTGRQAWLAAVGPVKRRDPAVIAIRLIAAIGDNHTHRWANAPWLFDSRARSTPLAERWGVDHLPLDKLGVDSWRPEPPPLETGSDDLSPTDRAVACLRRQDAGQLIEALALYGITLTPELANIRAGRPLGYAFRDLAPAWARAVQVNLRDCAPWRLIALLRSRLAEREAWVTAKRGRRWTSPSLRLFWLPHQTQQIKSAVLLQASDRAGNQPRLAIEDSASNAREPAVAWRRPIEIDLLRFGLLKPADIV